MERTPATVESGSGADGKVIAAGVEILSQQSDRKGPRRLLPFLGPAFVACVAYVDPGNFATNLEGGAKFGYTLLWVVVASNLIGMFVQALSAKLGIATGHNLAELCRMHYPRWLTLSMWIIMELVAMATDLAEFLGAALGFYLLFNMPLGVAGLLTAVVTYLILGLERYGFRRLEAVITAMVGVVAACYVIEMILARPSWGQVATHAFLPAFAGTESVLLATGILGATVMPHVIFLHSALMQGRIAVREPELMRRLYRYEIIDVLLAMGMAGLINAAMLIMAAETFHKAGLVNVDAIEKAYMTLQHVLGRASNTIFALSLLAAGLSSSAVGTMSGQVIMQGFLKRHIPIWLRRGLTMAPALAVILAGVDPTRSLVLSQVVLSFGLPFALVPLILFTRNRAIMGPLVNRAWTSAVAGVLAGLIVALNLFLLYRLLLGDEALFKHLLVPLDGSRLAEAALPAAIAVAQKSGAKVTLLHVIERHAPKSVHGNAHLRAADEAEEYLQRLARERFPAGLEVAWHVHRHQTDRVVQSLADHVEELNPDLIVMVSHGARRPEQWLFGTVSQQLVREESTPVLLVRPEPEGPAPAFREVLVPLDGQPDHEAGLPVAAQLARLFEASIRLLMVVPTRGSLSGEGAATGQLLPAATSEVLDLAAQQGAEYLSGHLRQLEQEGLQAAASLSRGDPLHEIEQFARQHGADVVVMSTHGAAGMQAFWSGSLGQRLIARLNVALLLVPVPVGTEV